MPFGEEETLCGRNLFVEGHFIEALGIELVVVKLAFAVEVLVEVGSGSCSSGFGVDFVVEIFVNL